MLSRRLAWGSCFVAAILLAGCGKKYPHGWVELDVPPAPVPSGWTAFKDAESGLSLAAPAGWLKATPGADPKIDALTDAARHKPLGTSHFEMASLTQGIHPNLFIVDTSAASLRELEFNDICVIHMDTGENLSIDAAERNLKQLSNNPLERVDLAIGPSLKQTAEATVRFQHGSTAQIKSIAYFFIRKTDLYAIRFTAAVDQFAALLPMIDQVMATVRLGAPDPSAVVQMPPQTANQSSTNGFGAAGMVPGDPGSIRGNDTPPPYDQPNQPQDQGQTTPQTSPPDNPNPSPDPGPTPDGSGDTGSTGTSVPGSNAPGPDPTGSNPPDQGQTTGSTGQPGSTGGG